MTSPNEGYDGPQVGDRVHIEADGTVLELERQDGVFGVVVDLGDSGNVWFPLDKVTVVKRG